LGILCKFVPFARAAVSFKASRKWGRDIQIPVNKASGRDHTQREPFCAVLGMIWNLEGSDDATWAFLCSLRNDMEPEGFWRWCKAVRITGFLHFVYCTEFQILENVSETGTLSVFRWGERVTYSVGSPGHSDWGYLFLRDRTWDPPVQFA
jgi:hypothetical protein